VETVGYLNIEFEGTALYLGEEAFLNCQYESALFVSIDEALARKKLNGADRGWVELDGTFDANVSANQVFAGVIRVRNIGAWPPSWLKLPEADPRSKRRLPGR
jgi:hypothetical protein